MVCCFPTQLIDKYGDDCKKMARDIKINVYQKTAAQLEKRIKIFKALLAL